MLLQPILFDLLCHQMDEKSLEHEKSALCNIVFYLLQFYLFTSNTGQSLSEVSLFFYFYFHLSENLRLYSQSYEPQRKPFFTQSKKK